MENDAERSRDSDESDLHIRAAAIVLKAGGIVAFPTDTLYGLGADAFNAEAVERIFSAKERDRSHGLPILIGSSGQLSQVAVKVSREAAMLAERFWPGALTLVLHRSPSVPDIVSGGGSTIAVRVPDHPVTLHLIEYAGGPIVGTSANRTGASDAASPEQVEEQLGPWLDYVIHAGSTPEGKPSTIVDMTTPKPQVLREGAVSSEDIFEALKGAPTEEDPQDEAQPVG